MINDGKSGKFDLIITKEISRFSRSVLDSITYTQQLLDAGVGVYFQSDNINTLCSDSELRLTIMSSLAQDEMRRLSERVKFGMKRAYESGKVLGQNNIYGYNKENGRLTVNEKEAVFIRELFIMYAEGKYGYRTIIQKLTEMGYRNQSGSELNPGTIKRILTNPKYKGYYHGRLTESSDYRRKKNIKLAEEDRLLYKDESVPAIVSEELWDKVNAVLNTRRDKFNNAGNGVQSRFTYSGKIICEEHGTHHYRKVWRDRKVPAESWCCKEYLAKGRAACATPHIYTKDLDAVLNYIGKNLLANKNKAMQSVDNLIALYEKSGINSIDYTLEICKTGKELDKVKSKQDKILELHIEGDIDKTEYLERNTRLKSEAEKLNQKLAALREEQAQANNAGTTLPHVKEFLNTLAEKKEIAGQARNDMNREAAREMLDKVTILKGSTQKELRIQISMKYGKILHCAILRPVSLCGKTEVSPIVGNERQSEDLIHYLLSEFDGEPDKIWQSNIFGKSLHDLVSEGLHSKLKRMPDDARAKLQETLQRIINEGSGGLLCIIL
jgi:DNA invertase Pin-like site-specific DNA recombinase